MLVGRAVLAGFTATMLLTAQGNVSFATPENGHVCANLSLGRLVASRSEFNVRGFESENLADHYSWAYH
jgi:hypothetical protein